MKNMLVASSHTYLLFITDTGRILWLKGYNIPEGSRQSKGKPIINMLPDLQPGESITNIIPRPMATVAESSRNTMAIR